MVFVVELVAVVMASVELISYPSTVVSVGYKIPCLPWMTIACARRFCDSYIANLNLYQPHSITLVRDCIAPCTLHIRSLAVGEMYVLDRGSLPERVSGQAAGCFGSDADRVVRRLACTV